MKKRIFISTNYMQIGGVERSIIGLLNSIDYDKYDVDFFIHSHSGEFMNMIPDLVNVLPEDKNYSTFGRPILELFKEGRILIGIARVLAKVYLKVFNKLNNINENYSSTTYVAKFTSPFLPSLYKYGEYDLAISFLIPHNIVLNKVNAKRKIAWIHSDYSFIGLDIKLELPIWKSYDYIGSISDDVTSTFINRFPVLEDKIILIENILSSEFVRKQSIEFYVATEIYKNQNEIILCSVGRFSKQKNFVNAVQICKYLMEYGLKIKWYLIGYGSEENIIEKTIKKLKMENHFIILGKKVNPYPYMKACDIYIQPSLYEGKAVTVREAQMLYKPVVITNFPTSNSQVKDGYDGIIVPLDNRRAAKGIYNFIKDEEKQKRIIEYLKVNDFGNEKEVEKIYKLI